MGAAAPAITTTIEESRRIEDIILEIKRPSGLIYNNNKSRRDNFSISRLNSLNTTPLQSLNLETQITSHQP